MSKMIFLASIGLSKSAKVMDFPEAQSFFIGKLSNRTNHYLRNWWRFALFLDLPEGCTFDLLENTLEKELEEEQGGAESQWLASVSQNPLQLMFARH